MGKFILPVSEKYCQGIRYTCSFFNCSCKISILSKILKSVGAFSFWLVVERHLDQCRLNLLSCSFFYLGLLEPVHWFFAKQKWFLCCFYCSLFLYYLYCLGANFLVSGRNVGTLPTARMLEAVLCHYHI